MAANGNFFQYYGLTEQEIGLTIQRFTSEKIDAKDFFLKQGEVSGKIGYVTSGLLRAFFYDDRANEITTDFYPPDSLVISFDSFNNQIPSSAYIVAVEDSVLNVISFQNMKNLYQTVPVWNQICKDFADQKSRDMAARTLQFQTLSAAERYNQFCQQYPEVVKKVALRHIASYLGIDIATLSRIRSKK